MKRWLEKWQSESEMRVWKRELNLWYLYICWIFSSGSTRQGTNRSHLGKRNIIFKSTFGRGICLFPGGHHFRGMWKRHSLIADSTLGACMYLSYWYGQPSFLPRPLYGSKIETFPPWNIHAIFKVIGMFSFGVKWLGVGALGLDPRKVNQGVQFHKSFGRTGMFQVHRFGKIWFLNELHTLAWFKQTWYVWEQVMTFKYILYIYI